MTAKKRERTKRIAVPKDLPMRTEPWGEADGITWVTFRTKVGHRKDMQLELASEIDLMGASGEKVTFQTLRETFRQANEEVAQRAAAEGVTVQEMRRRITGQAESDPRAAAIARYSRRGVIDIFVSELNDEPLTPAALDLLHDEVLMVEDAEWLRETALDLAGKLPETKEERGNASSASTAT